MSDSKIWAVLVQGQDDMYACADEELAHALAIVLNKQLKHDQHHGNPWMVAIVVEWPYSYESWKVESEQLEFVAVER